MDDTKQNPMERMHAEAHERGYYKSEMKTTAEGISKERREWVRHFDSFLESMMYHADVLDNVAMVQRARDLADRRRQTIEDKFPEGVDVE